MAQIFLTFLINQPKNKIYELHILSPQRQY